METLTVIAILIIYWGLAEVRSEHVKTKKELAKLRGEFITYKLDEDRRVKQIIDTRVHDLLERARK